MSKKTARPRVRLRMRFDLRVPPFASTTFGRQYQAMLEMVSWADQTGVSSINVSEHHGDPAGFMSSPVTVAAAILARTRDLRVNISAALAPLHDPVRLAEQLATADCIGPNRLSVVLGAGYRRVEFEMAGVERKERGHRLEESLRVLRQAWTGEPFRFRGRDVRVTPTPATPGGPGVYVGGKSVAAAHRAAGHRAGFRPAVMSEEVVGAYFDECHRLGFMSPDVFGFRSMGEVRDTLGDTDPERIRPGFVMLSYDPSATWNVIGRHAVFDAKTYASWQDDAVHSDWAVFGAEDWQELQSSGRYLVVTPEEALELATRDGELTLHPLMGGIEPHVAWEGLHILQHDVVPKLDVVPPAVHQSA